MKQVHQFYHINLVLVLICKDYLIAGSPQLQDDEQATDTYSIQEKEKEKEKEMESDSKVMLVVDKTFDNLGHYFRFETELISKTKKEMSEEPSFYNQVLNGDKSEDIDAFIIRLALILYLEKANTIMKLSFVNNNIDNDSNNTVVTIVLIVNDGDTSLNCDIDSDSDTNKSMTICDLFKKNEKMFLSLKRMAIKIGCFMHLYNMINDKKCDSVEIIGKFMSYYCYFDVNIDTTSTVTEVNDENDEMNVILPVPGVVLKLYP